MAFCGWTGYTSGNKEISELATKINTAYTSNYDIFVDGVKVQSIPKEVLKEYEMYNFLFDDIGGNVLINNKHTHYNSTPNNNDSQKNKHK